jgi:hypothetical protein
MDSSLAQSIPCWVSMPPWPHISPGRSPARKEYVALLSHSSGSRYGSDPLSSAESIKPGWRGLPDCWRAAGQFRWNFTANHDGRTPLTPAQSWLAAAKSTRSKSSPAARRVTPEQAEPRWPPSARACSRRTGQQSRPVSGCGGCRTKPWVDAPGALLARRRIGSAYRPRQLANLLYARVGAAAGAACARRWARAMAPGRAITQ